MRSERLCYQRNRRGWRLGYKRCKQTLQIRELKCSLGKVTIPTVAEKGLPTSDFRLRTSDFGLQTSDFRLQTSDFGLPTSDFRLPTSDFRLRTSDFGLQTSDFRLPTSDFGLPTSDFRLPTFVQLSSSSYRQGKK